MYNTTGSLARLKNKNIFSYFQKRSSLLQNRGIGTWINLSLTKWISLSECISNTGDGFYTEHKRNSFINTESDTTT
jgi:hypothetical protein